MTGNCSALVGLDPEPKWTEIREEEVRKKKQDSARVRLFGSLLPPAAGCSFHPIFIYL
jgi:hypothetical protein